MQIWILIILTMEIQNSILKFHIDIIGKMVKEDRHIKMSDYNLENFKEGIKANREFEFSYHDKMYSLTFSKEGYIFTDICGKKRFDIQFIFWVTKLYKHRREKIKEIIAEKLYDDLSIYWNVILTKN